MLKLKQAVDKMLAWSLIVLMSVLVIDVLWQVFSRYVLGDPSSFTEELARFLLIWVGLLGASYAAGKNLHLAVDILPARWSGKRRIYLELFIMASIVVFVLLVMVFGGARLVIITLYLGQTAAALQMPLGYVYIVLPLSGGLIAFYSVLFIVDAIRVLSGKPAYLTGETDHMSALKLNVD